MSDPSIDEHTAFCEVCGEHCDHESDTLCIECTEEGRACFCNACGKRVMPDFDGMCPICEKTATHAPPHVNMRLRGMLDAHLVHYKRQDLEVSERLTSGDTSGMVAAEKRRDFHKGVLIGAGFFLDLRIDEMVDRKYWSLTEK